MDEVVQRGRREGGGGIAFLKKIKTCIITHADSFNIFAVLGPLRGTRRDGPDGTAAAPGGPGGPDGLGFGWRGPPRGAGVEGGAATPCDDATVHS